MRSIVRVRDVMSSPPVDVVPETSLRDVAALLDEHEIGVVVVLGADGLEGVVSERDVVRALGQGADMDATCAADVMATEPVWVTEDDTVDDAAASMADEAVRHLPVLDEDGQVCGILSSRDVLRVLSA